MSQLQHLFFDEARENLDSMERSLLKFDPRGDALEQLNAIFRFAHSVKGGAAAFGYSNVAEFTHSMESLLDRLRSRQVQPDTPMIDLLLESVDAARMLLAWHQSGAGGTAERPDDLIRRLRVVALGAEPSPAARSLVIRIGPVDRVEDLQAVAALFRDIPRLGVMAELPDSGDGIHSFAVRTDSSDEELMALFAFHVAKESVSIRAVAHQTSSAAGSPGIRHPAEAGRGVLAEAVAALPARAELATIRVASTKIDYLAGLVAEFSNTQALLEQACRTLDPMVHAELLAGLGELRRNTLDLRQSVLAIRMIPMAVVFGRFPRMLRALARELGKKFTLVTQGDDVELDQAMVEKISDPLMHLVRNSCGHGIEMPADRIVAGKPEAGTIALSVAIEEDAITIEVRDDGRGLAREKILETARERGLEVSDRMADGALWQLVFAPGFSTVDVVTDVSGRGVGLDVVKRNVAALGGSVEIASTPGRGTFVSMRLPLSRPW